MSRQRFLYTLIIFLLLPWAMLHLLWRAKRQKAYLNHWGERLGYFARRKPNNQPSMPCLWLHAVSVGETRAAQPLVAALKARYPHHHLLMTHMTPTGREVSETLFGDQVEHCYLPYDTPGAMRRFLARFEPSMGIMMETEIWPNLLAECRMAGVPVCLLNARLSERSARRYARWPNFTRQILPFFSVIGAQTAEDATRFTALGAAAISVTGNIKFDIDPPPEQLALSRIFRDHLGNRPVWLAASTREGEEVLILDAWLAAMKAEKTRAKKVGAGETAKSLNKADTAIENTVMDCSTLAKSPDALLVIVPRHPQRFDDVVQWVAERGLSLQRRSENQTIKLSTQVVLGDSMGEMFAWYAAVDVAFIGGSLKNYGCQNLIEACAVGTPVLIGPSTFNFAEAAREALACGAARQIMDADELVQQANCLLADAHQRQNMSLAGREFVLRHRGATARSLSLVANLLQ